MEQFAKKKGKEGTRGAGQIMKENAATLVFYRNMIMGVNALYFATNTLMGHSYFTFDIVMFIISAILYIASFQMMRSMGQPADDTTPGLDLNMQGGMAEHLKVIFYSIHFPWILSLWNCILSHNFHFQEKIYP